MESLAKVKCPVCGEEVTAFLVEKVQQSRHSKLTLHQDAEGERTLRKTIRSKTIWQISEHKVGKIRKTVCKGSGHRFSEPSRMSLPLNRREHRLQSKMRFKD